MLGMTRCKNIESDEERLKRESRSGDDVEIVGETKFDVEEHV